MTGIFDTKGWIKHMDIPYPPPKRFKIPCPQPLTIGNVLDTDMCHPMAEIPIMLFELVRIDTELQLAYYEPIKERDWYRDVPDRCSLCREC
jgi:hypothetical protein